MTGNISWIGAVGAGVLSFLSPCVLPLVPLVPPYLCFVAGVSLDELRDQQAAKAAAATRVVALSIAFVLGFTSVFVALGASASLIGRTVSAYFETLSVVAGVVIVLLGLQFLGLLRFDALLRQARFSGPKRGGGLIGAYVVGLAFAFGWTPCVGPVLATILLIAGAESSAAHGAALLGAYSLGIGLPFILAAAFAGPFMALMARLRGHMRLIENVIGAALVLTGLMFLSGAMPKVSNWLLLTFPALGDIG